MTFQFDSLGDFLAMAGHGPYVWTAYGVSAVLLIWLLLRPFKQRRELFRQLARDFDRQVQQRGQARKHPRQQQPQEK